MAKRNSCFGAISPLETLALQRQLLLLQQQQQQSPNRAKSCCLVVEMEIAEVEIEIVFLQQLSNVLLHVYFLFRKHFFLYLSVGHTCSGSSSSSF